MTSILIGGVGGSSIYDVHLEGWGFKGGGGGSRKK